MTEIISQIMRLELEEEGFEGAKQRQESETLITLI